jgi:hypothetical protein
MSTAHVAGCSSGKLRPGTALRGRRTAAAQDHDVANHDGSGGVLAGPAVVIL